jgi:hypothetical protein
MLKSALLIAVAAFTLANVASANDFFSPANPLNPFSPMNPSNPLSPFNSNNMPASGDVTTTEYENFDLCNTRINEAQIAQTELFALVGQLWPSGDFRIVLRTVYPGKFISARVSLARVEKEVNTSHRAVGTKDEPYYGSEAERQDQHMFRKQPWEILSFDDRVRICTLLSFDAETVDAFTDWSTRLKLEVDFLKNIDYAAIAQGVVPKSQPVRDHFNNYSVPDATGVQMQRDALR